MKKILILQGIGMALLLPGAACAATQLLYGRVPAALWCAGAVCLAAAFAVFAAVLVFLRQQQRIMRFLVRQTAADREAGDARAGEILRRRMELTVLQNQINPHFLYNTLDGIRGEALANGQTEIANMTERLSRFFRYCIILSLFSFFKEWKKRICVNHSFPCVHLIFTHGGGKHKFWL